MLIIPSLCSSADFSERLRLWLARTILVAQPSSGAVSNTVARRSPCVADPQASFSRWPCRKLWNWCLPSLPSLSFMKLCILGSILVYDVFPPELRA